MSEIRVCDNCGYHNSIENLECEKCGFDLSFVIPVDEKDVLDSSFSDNHLEDNSSMMELEDRCDSCEERLLISSDQKTIIPIYDGMIIGRDSVSPGPLETSTFVSRRHASFSFDRDSVLITDASTNGTFINGKRLEKLQPTAIHDGDTIRFADVDFEVRFNAD